MKCAELVCVVLMLMLAVVGCTKEEPTQTQQSVAQVEKELTKTSEPAEQTKPSPPTRCVPVESVEEPAKEKTAAMPAEPRKPPELADPSEALRQAVARGNLDEVEKAIAGSADVNATVKGGFTNLHLALIQSHEEVAALLIANGADTHATMTNGTTPLHFAAMRGCKRIAEFLIDDGLDLNAQDQMQGTLLHFAALSGHVEIVELLIAKDADLTATNPRGQTALAIAERRGHTDIYELLNPDGARQ